MFSWLSSQKIMAGSRESSTRIVRKLQADNRTWVTLATGQALCGRSGTTRQQRLACQVLTDAGWRTTTSQKVAWGTPGYRAFVPAGAGAAYCRMVHVKKGDAVSCTPMTKHEWSTTHTSQRVRLVLPDAYRFHDDLIKAGGVKDRNGINCRPR